MNHAFWHRTDILSFRRHR